MALPSYKLLQRVLSESGSVVEAAECHGVLCGILCTAGASDLQGWVRYLFENRDSSDDLTAEALQVLHNVHQHTVEDISSESLSFELLLPDDDEPLSNRVQALSDWCGGFSFGLSLGGLNDEMLGNGDLREFVEDLQTISNSVFSADGERELEENSLIEIQQYVRLGVLHIKDELQPAPAETANAKPPTLH